MRNRKLFYWSLYDLGNTAFSALIITIFFPLLITEFLGGTDLHVGIAMGISLMLSAVIVPIAGGMSDATKVKRTYIIIFTLLAITTTLGIAYGNLFWAITMGLMANLFYHASLDIYDSILPDIVPASRIGSASGVGTAFGYVGTMISLVGGAIILNFLDWNIDLHAIRLIFIFTAMFFLFFSLFLCFGVKDKYSKQMTHKSGFKVALREIKSTLTDAKKHKNIWLFLLASFTYVGAANTLIIFLFRFGRESFGIGVQDFFWILGAMSLTAGAGSLIFGKMTDVVGPKNTLMTILLLWIASLLSIIVQTELLTYYIVGLVGGALLGGTWTATRPFMIQLAPKNKLAELLGFQGLTEKLGGVQPVVFGIISVLLDIRAALFSVLVFFVIGLIILYNVKEPGKK